MGILLSILLVPLIVFLIFYPVYLGLLTHKQLILKRLAAVDALLINRHDIVKALIAGVSKTMQKDATLIEEIETIQNASNKLRFKWNNNDKRFELEKQLDEKLNIFVAAIMNYPVLKNEPYIKKKLNEFTFIHQNLYNAINAYNTTLNNLKMLMNSPPGAVLAPMMKVKCEFHPYDLPK